MTDSLTTVSYSDTISTTKDIVNIIFFVAITIITILSYLKAKKTLLQPLRTEVFKEQLKVFSNILAIFNGKSEVDLREDANFEKFFLVNVSRLFDDYASLFFDVKFKRGERPYNIKDCPVEIVREEFLVSADEPYRKEQSKNEEEIPDPRTKAAIWNKYKSPGIIFPRETITFQDEIDKLMESPLIPKNLLSLLETYRKTINDNFFAVEKVLNDVAQELPEKYKNLEILKKATFSWVSNKYNKEFKELKSQADKITEYLRQYYSVDNLLE